MSDAVVIQVLEAEFRLALKQAKANHTRLFLELYAGVQVVSRHIRKLGFACLAFEIHNGPQYDLLRPCIHKRIVGWIRSGVICGVFLGTQCSSWSAALHGPPSSNWPRLRSNVHILGLPGLFEVGKEKVRIGNKQVQLSSQIVSWCHKCNVPCMLENPRTSLLWKYPRLVPLLKLSACQVHHLDQCQYGARWKKATTLAAWNTGHGLRLDSQCTGRKGICSMSGKQHIILTGKSTEHNMLWTSVAQEYPVPLARQIAQLLVSAFIEREFINHGITA